MQRPETSLKTSKGMRTTHVERVQGPVVLLGRNAAQRKYRNEAFTPHVTATKKVRQKRRPKFVQMIWSYKHPTNFIFSPQKCPAEGRELVEKGLGKPNYRGLCTHLGEHALVITWWKMALRVGEQLFLPLNDVFL